MKNFSSRQTATFAVICLASLLFAGPAFSAEHKGKHDPGSVMGMHYFQILVNHGLEMIIGANLVMLAEMKAVPGLDEQTLGRGRTLVDQGKKTIQRILSSSGKQEVSAGGRSRTPFMAYTHDLAAAMLKVADMLEKVKLETMNQDTRTLHQFHLLFAQALQMATVGANLMMVGQMGMSGDIVSDSVEHGKMMLADARSMIIEVMGSKAMAGMHGREAGKSPEMGLSHKLAGAVVEVLDLLDEMPLENSTEKQETRKKAPSPGANHSHEGHSHEGHHAK
ncbi:MAG: hypothetical protein AAGU11_07825 [Syntrophobacteraceae bacterium]